MVEQMKKIVVTGAKGQLGHELVQALSPQFVVHGFGRAELDITQSNQVRAKLEEIKPDIVIHAAAYTAVDEAEQQKQQAWFVNVEGSRHVAEVCADLGAALCYISTDYVFDGQKGKPYVESDEVNPLNYYGQTKLEGEKVVQRLCERHYIVRTSWLYGVGGPNFVQTMLRIATEQHERPPQQRTPLRVVNDQIGSPTYAADLARFISELMTTTHYGLYHASNEGACSWYDFAQAIFAEASMEQDVEPCTTEQFPRPAARPRYSVLDNKAMRDLQFKPFRPWREALRAYLKELQRYP